MTDPFVGGLTAIVGPAAVVTDPQVRAGYEVDWTGRYRGSARCVIRPHTVHEVVGVVRACAAAGVAIVPQGGNTGLVGGSVPHAGSPVVLSLRGLTRLDPVDVPAAQVTAGAGVTIEALQKHARSVGLDFGVDWGARASATVGGAVATNAGGSRVVRFGTMRSQVMGVQAVLADGSVVDDLRGLPKETVGPHLPSVLCGSEGTLAVITAARLRLVPRFAHHVAALVVLDSLDEAPALLTALRTLGDLDAVEVILGPAAELVTELTGLHLPLEVPGGGAAVIVDCAGWSDPTDTLAAAVGARRGVLADGAQRLRLFEIRDHITTSINERGVPLKLDVAVPIQRLAETVALTEAALARHAPAARLFAFGHLAEGNLHLNVLGAGEAATAISTDVLGAVVEMGGTISAEHGVGVAKVAWLDQVKGPGSAHALRAIKHALDPDGLLNPGVLFA
ncbi:MAG: FAD-binding oxidoreductase [Ilumatobacteraceae bacterium]